MAAAVVLSVRLVFVTPFAVALVRVLDFWSDDLRGVRLQAATTVVVGAPSPSRPPPPHAGSISARAESSGRVRPPIGSSLGRAREGDARNGRVNEAEAGPRAARQPWAPVQLHPEVWWVSSGRVCVARRRGAAGAREVSAAGDAIGSDFRRLRDLQTQGS